MFPADTDLGGLHPVIAAQRLLLPLTRLPNQALVAAGSVFLAFLLLKLMVGWLNGSARRTRVDQSMRGKTVIVTGGNGGIGFETAKQLAQAGARVVLACRSESRGQRAAETIRTVTGNQDVVCKVVDVGSLNSVNSFVADILRTETRLDVLINNAGITGPNERRLTVEGLEVTFATNYLGPFHLTNLLLELLERSAPSRIINVTSSLYRFGRVSLDDLDSRRNYGGAEAVYSSSKLALNLFTVELARRLKGTGVTCNALHPGLVATQFNSKEKGVRHFLWNALLQTCGQNPRDGARSTVYLATDPELEHTTGKYFVSCREAPWSSTVLDEELASRLWKKSQYFVREATQVSS